MKLTDAVDTSGHGFREIEERNRLKAIAEDVKIARCERLASAAGCTYEQAVAVLEMITADPAAYGITVAEEPKPFVKVKQTPGMIRSIRTNMRDLLLGFESLSRILPESERTELRDPIFHAVEALEGMGRPA